jgi:cytochrome c-type biogenesis protein CcmH/NrfG
VTRLRFLVAGATAGLTAVALLLGGLLAAGPSGAAAPAPAAGAQLAAGFAAGDTQALVLRLQEGLRARPANVRGLDLLGLA